MISGLALAVYGLLLVPGAVLVWRRPVLALYAWVVGLAAHNAVMAALYGAGVRGGALTALQAWKEILLGVALAQVAFEVLRARRLAFRVQPADVLALAFALLVCVYAVLPQDWLGGSADRSAIGLALKHDLIPVGAYFLGRSVILRREQLVPLVWTLVGAAAAVAVLGLLDDFLIPISWWRDSAFVARRRWPVAVAAATIAVSVAWVHVFPHVAPEGKWTKQDLVEQRNIARQKPGASGGAGNIDEPSIHSHWISLREGVRTVVHHPQGYGLGNAGQTASRTETPIKAGESNYTEIGAETGLLGSLLWTAWGLSILVALSLAARRTRWWAAVGIAGAFGAALVLAVQTDVIGDPWMGYVLWALAGIGVAPVALRTDGDRPAGGHRARSPEGERHRARARILP